MLTSEVYAKTFDEDVATNDCPECRGTVITNCKETRCADCGLVIAESPIDPGPEWREFDDPDAGRKRRTGGVRTPARHDHGLSTVIGRGTDGQGNTLADGKRKQLGRLRREHSRSKRPRTVDRNQVYGLTDIRRLTAALELPDTVRDRACSFFRRAQREDLLRGRSIEAFAAAAVYAACRVRDLPRTQNEIERLAKCDRSGLRNAIGVVNVELGLALQPPTPPAFVPRAAAAADVTPAVRKQALELAERADDADLTHGRNPFGVAATCVGIAADWQGITQTRMAEIAGVSTATIRNVRDLLQSKLLAEPDAR